MTEIEDMAALDPAGLNAAVRECARITAPEVDDAEFERIKAVNSPRYRNTVCDMERAILAYLRYAARTDAGAGYGVKPLEWRDFSESSALWIATTPFDDYRITKEESEWPYVVRPFRTPQSNYQTIEEAKTDCEADYERRIRSALVKMPPDAGYGAGFEACRELCRRAVFGELLQDCTGAPDDIAYNNAIHCALDAIAALPAPGGKEVTVESVADLLRNHGIYSANARLIAQALLSTFTITPKVQS